MKEAQVTHPTIISIRGNIAEEFGIVGEDSEVKWRKLYNEALQELSILKAENAKADLILACRIAVYLLAVALFTYGNWEMYIDILNVMPEISRKPRHPGIMCLRLLTPLPESFDLHSKDEYPAIRAWFDEHGDQIEWDSTENRYRWKSL